MTETCCRTTETLREHISKSMISVTSVSSPCPLWDWKVTPGTVLFSVYVGRENRQLIPAARDSFFALREAVGTKEPA